MCNMAFSGKIWEKLTLKKGKKLKLNSGKSKMVNQVTDY